MSATGLGTSTAAPTPSATHTILTPTPGSAKTPAPTDAVRQDLVIGDFGFTLDSGDAAYALILTNPNPATFVASFTSVQLTFYEGSNPLHTEEDYSGKILPGQTTAVTGEAFDVGGHPDRMTVRLGEPNWDEIDFTAGSFTISDIKTKKQEFGGWKTTGILRSTFVQRQENIRLDAVYRNAAGDVLGGDFTYLDFVDPDAEISFDIDTFVDFKGIDSTEVYWTL